MDPFVAEIMLFGGNFAPTGWALCNGQLMPISQNTALFSLLGTMYGGDGKTTFALPDLRASAPMSQGAGPGLSGRSVGETGGAPFVSLLTSEIPSHTHTAGGKSGNFPPPTNNPTNAVWGSSNERPYAPVANLVPMSAQALAMAGGSQPHNNLMPFLAVTFCIALQGVFPPRS